MRKPGDDVNEAKEESAAHRVAALLRADAIQTVDDQREQIGWQELLLEAQLSDEHRLRSPRAGRRWLAVGFAVAVGALAFAGGSLFRTFLPEPLTFQIDGREPADAQLAAGADETRRLDFSDGSRLVLRPSGRLRVVETNADGAALVLDRGELDVSVRHRARARWRLSVGPYTVKVTGTRFKSELGSGDRRDPCRYARGGGHGRRARIDSARGGRGWPAISCHRQRAARGGGRRHRALPGATRRNLTLPVAGRRSNAEQ